MAGYKRFYRRKKRNMRGKKLNKRQKKEVKKLIGEEQELKQTLNLMNDLAIDVSTTTPAYICLTDGILQGVTDTNERIGDRIKLKSLTIKASILLSNIAQNANNDVTVRMCVFQWHPQVDGTYASILTNMSLDQIFELGATGIVDPTSMYDWDQRQNYKILYDKTYHLVGPGNTANAYPIYDSHNRVEIYKHISLKKCRHDVQYRNTSSHVATNHVFIAFFQYDTSSDTNRPAVLLASRLTYTDS